MTLHTVYVILLCLFSGALGIYIGKVATDIKWASRAHDFSYVKFGEHLFEVRQIT